MVQKDIEDSLVHVKMLKEIQILSADDTDEIIARLKKLRERLTSEGLPFLIGNEDTHVNIEALLTEEVDPVASKLYIGRSGNDQVATDLRLYVKKRLPIIANELKGLQAELVDKAVENAETIVPGYTHMQHV